jgi:hypothetical protein
VNKVWEEIWTLDQSQVRIAAGSGWIGDTAARPGYSTTPDDEARMRLIACAPEMARALLSIVEELEGVSVLPRSCQEIRKILEKAGIR